MKDKTCISDFNSPLSQSLGFWLAGIASDTANLELLGQFRVVEDGADDGSALLAGGTEDSDDLRHFACEVNSSSIQSFCCFLIC